MATNNINSLKQLNSKLLILSILFVFATLFIFLGATLNYQAVYTNSGKMPVYNAFNDTGDFKKHFYYEEQNDINRSYLADNYYVGGRYTTYHFSFGDVLLTIGVLFAVGFEFMWFFYMFINNTKYKYV